MLHLQMKLNNSLQPKNSLLIIEAIISSFRGKLYSLI